MGLTADQATRMTPMLLVGVILAGGFALVVHLSPRGEVAQGEIIAEPLTGEEADPDFAEKWDKPDWLALNVNLRELNHLVDDEPEPQGGEDGPDDVPEPRPAGGTTDIPYEAGFKFVGAIVLGDRSVALISLDGKQRFVGVDDEIGKHTVVSVHADHLIVRVDGVDRRMVLADAKNPNQDSMQRMISDRNRAMELQRLQSERRRNDRGIPSPDSGGGR